MFRKNTGKRILSMLCLTLMLVAMLFPMGLSLKANAATAKKTEISDPTEYFGKAKEVTFDKEKNKTTYRFAKVNSPDAKLSSYVKELQSSGLQLKTSMTVINGDKLRSLYLGGKNAVIIWWTKSSKELTVSVFHDRVTVAEEEPTPTTEPEETIHVLDEDDCMNCRGSGRCPDCGGDGQVMKWVSGTTRDYVSQNCRDCSGMGRCRRCYGSGKQ